MIIGEDRAGLAAAVVRSLTRCRPGSRARLIGSLGAGTADAFSDIDIAWVVADREFPACLEPAVAALREILPVAAVRCDPDFRHSARRRLLFIRFRGVSPWWRLDLDVRAASVAHDPSYDLGNPAARAGEGEWSRPASALANAVGAIKAVARGREGDARGLLDRGFARIGVEDHATGAWVDDVARLAAAAVRGEAELAELAAEVGELAARHLGERPG